MYEQISYETALEEYLALGFEPWQGDAVMEIYQGIDSGAKWANIPDISDFKKITGEEPTSLRTWLAQILPDFKIKTLKH